MRANRTQLIRLHPSPPRILETVTNQTPQAAGRPERILAYMVAAVVGLSILAFFTVIIATSMGAGANNGFGQGVWPAILALPLVGLPIGFTLIIVLLVTNAVRRAREARQNRE
jgi:TRAP-type C4-dicarboxylate transport system permease small subunit